jgi:hypothetical protein
LVSERVQLLVVGDVIPATKPAVPIDESCYSIHYRFPDDKTLSNCLGEARWRNCDPTSRGNKRPAAGDLHVGGVNWASNLAP